MWRDLENGLDARLNRIRGQRRRFGGMGGLARRIEAVLDLVTAGEKRALEDAVARLRRGSPMTYKQDALWGKVRKRVAKGGRSKTKNPT